MKKMYFGTREKMQWVKCPATNISRNRAKWQETGAYLNGGAFSAASAYSHIEYNIAWNLMASEEAAKIMSYFEGVHGDGLIHFLEPFAKKSNVLPLHWSVPRLCAKDAPNLLPAGSARPTEVPARVAVATNLATNPSFEATSGTVEVRRNFATNPSFEATSGTVEVQRNYFPDTNCSSWNPAWGGYAGNTGATWVTSRVAAPWAIGGYAIQAEWTAVPDQAGDLGPVISEAPVDETWTVAFDVVVNRTGAVLSGVGFGGSPATSTIVARSHSAALTMTAGVPVRRWMTFVRAAAAAPSGFRSATVINNKIVGDKIQIANVDLYPGAYNPARIAATGTVSTDSDLTPSFAGTVNASASVLTGAAVADTATANCAGVSSTSWSKSGARSLRLIPTNAANADSHANLGGGAGGLRHGMQAGKTYTALSTSRLSAPRAGAATARIMVFHRAGGTGSYTILSSTPAPNTAGEFGHRLTFTLPAGTTEAWVRLTNGVALGGGDVWWDNLAVVEGNYTGPYFDGSTSPDSDLTPSWTGTANASASVLTGAGVAGVTAIDLAQGVQYRTADAPVAGSSALRTTLRTASVIGLPVIGFLPTTGTTYTMLLRARARTRTTTVTPRIRGAVGAPVTLPMGVWTEIRLTIAAGSGTLPQTGFLIASGSGHQPGDLIDVDCLAIIEGVYTGPWFDGSNPPGSGTYTAWTGAANASTSTLTSDIGGGRPATSAQFTAAGTDGTNPTVYVPVPPGENFYMEVCGVAGGSAGVRVIPDRGSAVTLAPTALETPATATLPNPGGVTLRFAGTGTLTLNSMRATVGTSAPDYSVFRQGEGNSGVRFNGNPVRTGYSSALDLESVTAEFVEVGAWL